MMIVFRQSRIPAVEEKRVGSGKGFTNIPNIGNVKNIANVAHYPMIGAYAPSELLAVVKEEKHWPSCISCNDDCFRPIPNTCHYGKTCRAGIRLHKHSKHWQCFFNIANVAQFSTNLPLPWYVLYTKPKNEKKTAQRLSEKGMEVYCPLQESLRQWSDRKKKIQEPLFKSYIFIRLDDYKKEQVDVLTTPGAVRFLWWLGKPGVVREEEINAIRQFLNDYKGAAISVHFEKGDEVAIKEGALKEQTGTILVVKGNKAFLTIRSLGWNVVAELPVQALERKKNTPSKNL